MAQWWADHLDILRKGAEVVPMRAVNYRRVEHPSLAATSALRPHFGQYDQSHPNPQPTLVLGVSRPMTAVAAESAAPAHRAAAARRLRYSPAGLAGSALAEPTLRLGPDASRQSSVHQRHHAHGYCPPFARRRWLHRHSLRGRLVDNHGQQKSGFRAGAPESSGSRHAALPHRRRENHSGRCHSRA